MGAKKQAYTEMRLHSVVRHAGECHTVYRRRAEERRDAKRCRQLRFEQQKDLKLISVIVGRSLEWVRDAIAHKIHGCEL